MLLLELFFVTVLFVFEMKEVRAHREERRRGMENKKYNMHRECE